ncbi:hypothetical protein J6590_008009 [Homalodisca vitripennis]|nr:hypothetical protein J6590_008009 [Homalodisca vitripennis]
MDSLSNNILQSHDPNSRRNSGSKKFAINDEAAIVRLTDCLAISTLSQADIKLKQWSKVQPTAGLLAGPVILNRRA